MPAWGNFWLIPCEQQVLAWIKNTHFLGLLRHERHYWRPRGQRCSIAGPPAAATQRKNEGAGARISIVVFGLPSNCGSDTPYSFRPPEQPKFLLTGGWHLKVFVPSICQWSKWHREANLLLNHSALVSGPQDGQRWPQNIFQKQVAFQARVSCDGVGLLCLIYRYASNIRSLCFAQASRATVPSSIQQTKINQT